MIHELIDDVVTNVINNCSWNKNRTFSGDHGGYKWHVEHPDVEYDIEHPFHPDINQSGNDWRVKVGPFMQRMVYNRFVPNSSDMDLIDVLTEVIKTSRIVRPLINYQRVVQPDFYDLQKLVLAWAWERDFFTDATVEAQAEKTIEEAKEILDAIKAGDRAEIADGLGDTLVTLIVQAHMQGLDLIQCLNSAYLTIADRTGRMVNGVFVKDGQQED